MIDEHIAFVTSANFTEAAQLRNIEVGTVIRDGQLALRLVREFDELVKTRALKSLPL